MCGAPLYYFLHPLRAAVLHAARLRLVCGERAAVARRTDHLFLRRQDKHFPGSTSQAPVPWGCRPGVPGAAAYGLWCGAIFALRRRSVRAVCPIALPAKDASPRLL